MENRGGPRKGAGRPPAPPGAMMIRKVIQITPDQERFIKALAKDTGMTEAGCFRHGIELLMHTNNGKLALLTIKKRR